MIATDLPAPRGGTWLGVVIERHAVAGTAMWAVTIRPRAGRPIERIWFEVEGQAMAFAFSQADAQSLPFFDLREPDAD